MKLFSRISLVFLLANVLAIGSAGAAVKSNNRFEIFTWFTAGGEADGLKAIAAEFRKQNPKTTFNNNAVVADGISAKGVLVSRMEAGNPPDTFQAHAGAELSSYVKAEQLEDLTELYKAEGWDKVFPADLIKTLTTDGKIHSVPLRVYRTNLLWWNPASAKKAGITKAPASLDEMIADMEKFKKVGIDGIALAGQGDWAIAHLFDYVLLASMGADKFNGLWNGGTAWDGPEVSKAIDYLTKILSYGNSSKSLDWPDAGKLVTSGKAGFLIMGDWVKNEWQSQGLVLGKNYSYSVAPQTSGTFQWAAESFVLPKGAANTRAAKSWLKLCGSKLGQAKFNSLNRTIGSRIDQNQKVYDSFQKSQVRDWSKDVLVGSTILGVNYNNAGMAGFNTAVGQFYQSADKDQAEIELFKYRLQEVFYMNDSGL